MKTDQLHSNHPASRRCLSSVVPMVGALLAALSAPPSASAIIICGTTAAGTTRYMVPGPPTESWEVDTCQAAVVSGAGGTHAGGTFQPQFLQISNATRAGVLTWLVAGQNPIVVGPQVVTNVVVTAPHYRASYSVEFGGQAPSRGERISLLAIERVGDLAVPLAEFVLDVGGEIFGQPAEVRFIHVDASGVPVNVDALTGCVAPIDPSQLHGAITVGPGALRPMALNYDFGTNQIGAAIGGLGGWSSAPADGVPAIVTNLPAFSRPGALSLRGTGELTHPVSGASNGVWVARWRQFIPSTATGIHRLRLLNRHPSPPDDPNGGRGVELQFDLSRGQVSSTLGGGVPLPLVRDRWVEVRCEVDLNINTVSGYYDGRLLGTHDWQTNPGPRAIQAVQMRATAATAAFYDDIMLSRVPPRATVEFAGLPFAPVGQARLNREGVVLTVTNLGASGLDGLTASLPRASQVDLRLAGQDGAGGAALAEGGTLELHGLGVLDGVPHGSLLQTRVHRRAGNRVEIQADFRGAGSTHLVADAFKDGLRVGSAPVDSFDVTGDDPVPQGLIIFAGSSCTVTPNSQTYHNWIVIIYALAPGSTVNINGTEVEADRVEIMSEDSPYLNVHLTGLTLLGRNVGRIAVADARVTPFGVPWRMRDHLPLGQSSLMLTDRSATNHLTVGNLGGSGADGVSIDLGRAASVSTTWQPLDPRGSSALGSWIQAHFRGSVLGEANRSLGFVRVTHDRTGPAGFAITGDLRPLGSPTIRLEAWREGRRIAVHPNQSPGLLARASTWPIGGGKLGLSDGEYVLGCIVLTWSAPGEIAIDGQSHLADELRILQESPAVVDHLSAFELTAAGLDEFRLRQESVVDRPSGQRLVFVLKPNHLELQWTGPMRLQESDDLIHWTDLPAATSPHLVPITSPASHRYFRLAP